LALFRFQLDAFIILYNYNLGFLSISTCFGQIGPSSGESNALIAQAASGTVPSVVVCLAWPLVLDSPDVGPIGPKHVEKDKKPRL
jgi:hypothetical protein